MDDAEAAFGAALDRRAAPQRPELTATALAAVCCEVLGVEGATVSVVGPGAWRLPIGAGDEAAAGAERWMFASGQGPAAAGVEAVVTGEERLRAVWPVLHDQLRTHTPFRSLLTVPVRVPLERGAAGGVLDLFCCSATPDTGGASDLARVRRVAALVGAGLADVPGHDGGEPPWMDAPTAQLRQRVWMTVRMAHQVLGLDEADAVALLRACAYGQDRTVDALADDVVAGRTSLRALLRPEGP